MRNEKFYTPTTVPDGEYTGRWGGYEINFEHEGREVNVCTIERGVRGINIPCKFRIVNGRLDESTLETT